MRTASRDLVSNTNTQAVRAVPPGEKDGAARSGARTRPPNSFDSAIFSLVCA